MHKHIIALLLMSAVLTIAVGCSEPTVGRIEAPVRTPPHPAAPVLVPVTTLPAPVQTVPAQAPTDTMPPPPEPIPVPRDTKPAPSIPTVDAPLVSNPTDVTALVNKLVRLPADYRPADLVVPEIPFIFTGADEKRLMRKEAAQALEAMFEAASQSGIHLAGASGFRSYATQKYLFSYYVNTYGDEHARRYSAEPGHSEHQTGLAMDVSGSRGYCAIDDCFADTPEADWLDKHAHEHGFIIRYPKGKEAITGYAYEPWHLRYVGTAMSSRMAATGLTLEEYYGEVR